MKRKLWLAALVLWLVAAAGCGATNNNGQSSPLGDIGRGNMWDDARFVAVDVPLDPVEAKKILPLGMLLSNPPRATLFIVDYPKTSFTVPYKEAAVLIHVRTVLGAGVHCPWMVVDDDTALIYGRELLGYPKKLAEIVFDQNGDHVSASVTRRGVKVMSIEADCGAADEPRPVLGYKTFNAGGMGQAFVVQQIWMFKPEEVIHDSFAAEVLLTLERSEFDPIASLVSGEPVSGRIVTLDIPNSKYILPVGMTGPGWFFRTFNLRYR